MTETHLGWFSAVILMTLSLGFLVGLTIGAWWLLRDEEPRPNRKWSLAEWLVKHRLVK
jgi:hypothetical protein